MLPRSQTALAPSSLSDNSRICRVGAKAARMPPIFVEHDPASGFAFAAVAASERFGHPASGATRASAHPCTSAGCAGATVTLSRDARANRSNPASLSRPTRYDPPSPTGCESKPRASSERGVDVATTQPLCAVLSGSLARRLTVAQFKIGDLRGVQVESL